MTEVRRYIYIYIIYIYIYILIYLSNLTRPFISFTHTFTFDMYVFIIIHTTYADQYPTSNSKDMLISRCHIMKSVLYVAANGKHILICYFVGTSVCSRTTVDYVAGEDMNPGFVNPAYEVLH